MNDWAQEDQERRLVWFQIWAEVVRWCAQVATPILLGLLVWRFW